MEYELIDRHKVRSKTDARMLCTGIAARIESCGAGFTEKSRKCWCGESAPDC